MVHDSRDTGGKGMSMNSSFSWLPVTTMPDGSELRLPLHVVKGSRPGPTLGLTSVVHGAEVLPTVTTITQGTRTAGSIRTIGHSDGRPGLQPSGSRRALTQYARRWYECQRRVLGTGSQSVHRTSQDGERADGRSPVLLEVLAHLDYHIDFHCGGTRKILSI